jgi:hypothetical protein
MTEPPPIEPRRFPQYCAILLDTDGHVAAQIPITASDDEEARAKAKALVDGHAIDL